MDMRLKSAQPQARGEVRYAAHPIPMLSMKNRLFCCVLTALTMPAWAAPNSPVTSAEEDRARYMEFLEEYSKAQVCFQRIPGFDEKFAPLLRKWKVRNEAIMRTGDSFIRTEARLDEITIEEKIEKATRTAVDKLRAMPDAEIGKACGGILNWFGPDGPFSGKPPEPAKPASPPAAPVAPASR